MMPDIETSPPTATAHAPKVSLGALRHRDFRILWVAIVISNIGTGMHIVAQSWLMYQLTNLALWLGLVGLMRAIPLLSFPLAGGVIADRVSRITVLYITQTSAALLALALAVITALGEVSPWHILVYAFLGATLLAFDGPAREALLPDLIDADDMMSAIRLNSWAFNGAILLGPALPAMLLPSIGIAGVFGLNAVSFGAVLIALPLLRGRVMSVNTIAWQGLEYVGVLLTGAFAAVWAAPPVVAGAAIVMAGVVVGVALRYREISGLA